jgi:hypothetical protein
MFRHGGQEWIVAGISSGELFNPSAEFGIKPVGSASCCWRGYIAAYAIHDGRLVIEDLHLNLREIIEDAPKRSRRPKLGRALAGPEINGHKPEKGGLICNNRYRGIDYPLNYTGGLFLARDFVKDLYVHMGFHAPWKYRHVIQLNFDGGLLLREADLSETMAEVRRRYREAVENSPDDSPPSPSEIRRWIERSFDRTFNVPDGGE